MENMLSLHLKEEVGIPHQYRLGCVHTVLRASQGGLYLSDEINHALICLDAQGCLRWLRNKQGSGLGEFWYPKGIEHGLIMVQDHVVQCIGVCDSWNRRVQFFDQDGNFLKQWKSAGEIAFADVVDLRFLGNDSGSEAARACWLVLDRGNHRLYGMDLQGNLLFQMGRPLYESFECRWPTPCIQDQEPWKPQQECIPFDPTFMPLRIFGATPEALYLWEPLTGRLKMVCCGNLLPVWIDRPIHAEWIAADADSLLAYDARQHTIFAYDPGGSLWCSARLLGTPIPCGRSSSEIWIQDGNKIRCLVSAAMPNSDNIINVSDPAGASAAQSGPAFRSYQPDHAISALQQEVERFCNLGRTALLKPHTQNNALEDLLHEFGDGLAVLHRQFKEVWPRTDCLSHDQFLALLQKHLPVPSHPAIRKNAHILNALEPLTILADCIVSMFASLLRLRDEMILACFPRSTSGNISPDSASQRGDLISRALSSLIVFMASLARWDWIARPLQSSENGVKRLGKKRNGGHVPDVETPFPAIAGIASCASSRRLHERDRIFVGQGPEGLASSPAVIASARDGGLLVTLYNAHSVLKLDMQGKVLGPIGLADGEEALFQHPLGVTVDDFGHVWVSEPASNRIIVFNPATQIRRTLDEFAGQSVRLNRPAGLHACFGNRILIADEGNNRILAATPSGKIEIIFNRAGHALGELRHPVSFCAGATADTYWIVDRLNHRLQEICRDGTPRRQFGHAGLGRGCLDLPEQAAVLNDGSLVITQSACVQALTVISPDGEEVGRLQLQYAPKGLFVHGNFLWVCEWSGNHVYIYEIS